MARSPARADGVSAPFPDGEPPSPNLAPTPLVIVDLETGAVVAAPADDARARLADGRARLATAQDQAIAGFVPPPLTPGDLAGDAPEGDQ